MPNPAIKIVTSIAFFGSLTTGSYFLRDYYTKERVNHRISSFGKTLLTSSDNDAEWAKRWKEYVADNGNIWRLKDYETASKTKDKAPKSFKDKCLNNSNLIIEHNQSLSHQIENWCTKSFKVEELLSREKNIKLLDESDGAETWKEVWNNYFQKNYRKNNPLGVDKFDTFTSTSIPDTPSDYKTKCIGLKEREVRSLRDTNYQNTKKL